MYNRNFGSKTFLTYGKRRHQTGLSGTIKRPRLAIGLRNSGAVVKVLTSGTRRRLPMLWLVLVGKYLSDIRRASYRWHIKQVYTN